MASNVETTTTQLFMFIDESTAVHGVHGIPAKRRSLVHRHVAINTKIQKKQKKLKRSVGKEYSQAQVRPPKLQQQQKLQDDESDQNSQEMVLVEDTISQMSLADRMRRLGPLRGPLPAGRKDPFSTLSVPVDNTRELELLDYLTNVIWPGFSEYDSEGNWNPFAIRWLKRSARNLALRHALLMASSSHLEARPPTWNKNPKLMAEQLYHENEAVRLVRHQLSNLDSTDVNETLMIILCLATNPCRQGVHPPDPSPFNPPLRSLNWINVYGASDFSAVHWNALLELVEKIGGLSRIKVYGLPWVISMGDLLQAAASMRKPCYPMLNPQGQVLSFERLESFAGAFDLSNGSARRGWGFGYLNLLGFDNSHVDPFHDLADFSATLHAYHEGLLREPVLTRIADSRNALQHSLLSLPSEEELERSRELDSTGTSKQVTYIYEACRMTALLYSVMVTFPLPRSKYVRDRVLPALDAVLSRIEPYSDGYGLGTIYLWCLTVAGIAASGYPTRLQYAERLGQVSAHWGICSWPDVERALESFAWLKCACSVGGESLWAEAQQLREA